MRVVAALGGNALLRAGRSRPFADGSMGPKVDAACRFVDTTGGLAGIGALSDARAILEGCRGTRVNAAERFTPA